ncbi:MAG: S26 family signal peptidase [Pseudomonadota bacterium]|nr:S26 family signal peptidase [Pseudomonadota bacterium]
MQRRALGGLAAAGLCALSAALLLPLLAWVPDDEMAPSFLAGDLVVILPVEARAGDVVAIVDPLDPARWTLRRVETIGGAVRYEDSVFHTAGADAPRVLEMDRNTARVVRSEGSHLVELAARPVRWELSEAGVPEDAAFLGADARDAAMDSRWWGPVPLQALQGVVALRIGVPGHPWRGWTERRP